MLLSLARFLLMNSRILMLPTTSKYGRESFVRVGMNAVMGLTIYRLYLCTNIE